MVTFSSFVNTYNFLVLMEIHHEAQYEGFIFQILTLIISWTNCIRQAYIYLIFISINLGVKE